MLQKSFSVKSVSKAVQQREFFPFLLLIIVVDVGPSQTYKKFYSSLWILHIIIIVVRIGTDFYRFKGDIFVFCTATEIVLQNYSLIAIFPFFAL